MHLSGSSVGVILTYRSDEHEAEAVVEEITGRGGTAAKVHLDVTEFGTYANFV